MQHVGLYYPYVHFRDEQWIKAAALYWPRLARVVPTGFPVADPEPVKDLCSGLDFVVDLDPRNAAEAITSKFLQVLQDHRVDLQERFLATPGTRILQTAYEQGRHPELGRRWVNAEPTAAEDHLMQPLETRPLAGLYWDEVHPRLRDAFFDAGLAVKTSRSQLSGGWDISWFATDPVIAWVYKCALTEELARRSKYTPTTDQISAHSAADGWDTDRIAAALLGRLRQALATDAAERLGVMAVKCVLPEDLSTIPIEKIIELRKRYKGEFNAFTEEVEKAAADLQQHVDGIEDQEAFQRYLRDKYDGSLAGPLRDLRKALQGQKIKTFFGVLNYTFSVPTAAVLVTEWAGLHGAAQKTAVTSVGASIAVATLVRGAVEAHDTQISDSPVGYLLRVERNLRPAPLARRVAQAISRPVRTRS